MTKQPIPIVTEDDVARIALRDFGEAQTSLVRSILDEYGKLEGHVEVSRVRVAVLKLANGDFDRLLAATETACQDYRNVLAYAEYPRAFQEIGFAAIEDDWKQHQEWLEKE